MSFEDAFATFPVLDTPRLHLRQVTLSDAPALYANVTTVQDWWAASEIESLAATRRRISAEQRCWARGTRLRWGVTLKPKTEVLGAVELSEFRRASRAEIGYWLARPYWHHGLMAEALTTVLRYSFDVMNLHRVYAITLTNNHSSIALLTKVGFQAEGLLRQHSFRQGRWQDALMLGALAEDFRPR